MNNYNKDEINYHELANFIKKRFESQNHYLLSDIASNVLVLLDSLSFNSHLTYKFSIKKVKEFFPIDKDYIEIILELLKDEKLLDYGIKNNAGQNELFYFVTPYFYRIKNEYMNNFEKDDILNDWNDFFEKFDIREKSINDISIFLENKDYSLAEKKHLNVMIYAKMIQLLHSDNYDEIENIKLEIYKIIDEYKNNRS